MPRFASAACAAIGARNSLLRRQSGLADGPVPEALLTTLAHETCRKARPIECTTILARGLADHPGSEQAELLLQDARTRKELPDPLSPADLRRLEGLYGNPAEHASPPESQDPVSEDNNLTDGFMRFFHHALPFDRRVLERAWDRCIRAECRTARSRALRSLEDAQGTVWEHAGIDAR